MTNSDHIKSVLKDVFRGRVPEGQSLEEYLESRAKQILEYCPGKQEKAKPSDAPKKFGSG